MVVEVWRPLEDFPRYEVSSFGRVRNAETGRVLRREITPAGYARVDIMDVHGRYRKEYIHKLVYVTFVDSEYVYGRLKHIDGDNLNNSWDNIALHNVVEPFTDVEFSEDFW